jgi:hypothetical protein
MGLMLVIGDDWLSASTTLTCTSLICRHCAMSARCGDVQIDVQF